MLWNFKVIPVLYAGEFSKATQTKPFLMGEIKDKRQL